MSPKRIAGLVILILGVILIIYSVHSMNRIAEAKNDTNMLTSPLPHNTAGEIVTGVMQNNAGQYDTTVMALLISGIALAAVGGCLTLFCGNKKK